MQRIQDKLNNSEYQYRQALEASAKAAHKRGVIMSESGVKTLDTLEQQIKKLMKPEDELGNALDPAQIAANRAKADDLIRQFLSVARGANLANAFDFTDVKRQLRAEIKGVDIEIISTTPAAMATFHQQLQNAVSAFDLKATVVGLLDLQMAAGMRVNNPEDADKALGMSSERLKAISHETSIADQYMTRLSETTNLVNQAIRKINPDVFKEVSYVGSAMGGPAVAVRDEQEVASKQELLALQQSILAASEKEALTRAEVLALTERAKALNASSSNGPMDWWQGGGLGAGNVNALYEALNALQEKAKQFEASGLSSVTGSLEQHMANLREESRFIEEHMSSLEAKYGSALAQGLGILLQTESTSQRIAANLERAAKAQALAGSAPLTESMGGHIRRFASGGYARGVDQIPAMLAAGEHVTNSRSSRRFFSQLQAINAGQQPAYRQSGGSVTNIGDVSITVKDSGSPQATAREVMQAIRRESRRGSSRI